LDKADYEILISKIKASFIKLPTSVVLSYVDSEGDRISVSDTNDLNVIFEIPNQKSIRLEIEDFEEKVTEVECEVEDFERFSDLEILSEMEKPAEVKVSSNQSKGRLLVRFDPE